MAWLYTEVYQLGSFQGVIGDDNCTRDDASSARVRGNRRGFAVTGSGNSLFAKFRRHVSVRWGLERPLLDAADGAKQVQLGLDQLEVRVEHLGKALPFFDLGQFLVLGG
jgi:hypothetical protein